VTVALIARVPVSVASGPHTIGVAGRRKRMNGVPVIVPERVPLTLKGALGNVDDQLPNTPGPRCDTLRVIVPSPHSL
jgi:hypothetical protein